MNKKNLILAGAAAAVLSLAAAGGAQQGRGSRGDKNAMFHGHLPLALSVSRILTPGPERPGVDVMWWP